MIHNSRRPMVMLVLLLLLSGLAVTLPTHAIDATAHLQSIKSRLPFISTHDFLYRREPRDLTRDKEQVAAAFRVLMELESSQLRVADLVRLTSHSDPDIRSLALLGLVARESREVIPACMRLMNDDALTLPLQQERRSIIHGDVLRVATEPQKVGQIARRILRIVKCPLPYERLLPSGELNKVATPEIEKWWAQRNDNPDWLTWYEFLYLRASQGTSPIPETARERIVRFRKQVDGLPVRTRAWLLLYLADEVYSMDGEWRDNFASMEEMLAAVKVLGPERLVVFLKDGQRRGLRDPQLGPAQGQRFIIMNAVHLFRKEHAPALLELKHFTAAADADPTIVRHAVELGMHHLSQDYQSGERGRLMAALAVHGDAADREAAAKWFYAELNSAGGSSAQSAFISAVRYRRPGHCRAIIRPIVAHRDFDRLRPMDVMYLARLVQKSGNGPLVEINSYREQPGRLRNELRRLFDVPVVASKTLAVPKVVLPKPVWSQHLVPHAHSLAMSDDGKLLAIGMDESEPAVQVVNAQDGQLLQSFNEPSGRYFRVEFVSHQKLVFAPKSNNLTGNLLTWTVDDATHRSVIINPDRDRQTNTRPQIIPSRQDGRVALLDTKSLGWFEDSETAWRFKKRGRGGTAFEVSPDARWIAFNDGFQQQIELVDTQGGRVRHVLAGLSTVPARMCFSPDSKRLMGLGGDNRLIIWDTRTGREVTRYLGIHARFGPLGFSTDEKSFFAGAGQGHVGCFSTADRSPQFAFPFRVRGTPFNANKVQSVVPSPDHRHLFALLTVSRGDPLRPTWKSRIQKWRTSPDTAE